MRTYELLFLVIDALEDFASLEPDQAIQHWRLHVTVFKLFLTMSGESSYHGVHERFFKFIAKLAWAIPTRTAHEVLQVLKHIRIIDIGAIEVIEPVVDATTILRAVSMNCFKEINELESLTLLPLRSSSQWWMQQLFHVRSRRTV